MMQTGWVQTDEDDRLGREQLGIQQTGERDRDWKEGSRLGEIGVIRRPSVVSRSQIGI